MAEPLPHCYLDGVYQPLSEARISPLDRGFLFADSVYEVVPVFAGRMFRCEQHLVRLEHSLNAIGMANPHSLPAWQRLLEELIRRNGSGDMNVYLQVTRGTETGRDHRVPQHVTPTIFAMAMRALPLSVTTQTQGVSAITVDDIRWSRCDIKSTALLANVMLREQAAQAQADEALLIRDGLLSEGSSSNVFVVIDGELRTPPLDRRILPGTTREVVLELARALLPVNLRPVGVDELQGAQEIWISSASRNVAPVTRLNGAPVGSGTPGPHWQAMHQSFERHLRQLVAEADS